jgi:dihydroflavonol-4-reductase
VRAFVTGATGFVGSRLTEALVQSGHQVRVLRRKTSNLVGLSGLDVEHVLGDVRDQEAAEKGMQGCDVVFHTAAVASYWRAQRSQIYQVNLEGTRSILRASLAAGVPRFVHTSSVATIGIVDTAIANEDTPFTGQQERFAYAHSKHLAEAEVQEAVAQGLSAVIVNPAVVIGAGDHNLISGSLIVELARRAIPAVPPGGVCVVDIDAVVQGHIAAAERGRDGERYILGGENLPYRRMAGIICEIVGRRAPQWTLPAWLLPPAAMVLDAFNRLYPKPPLASGDQLRLSAQNAFFDSSKAVRELNFPLLPFRDAARKAYEWYLKHGYLG